MCIFFLLVGIYFGITAYIGTKKREILVVLVIFVGSLVLEFDRLNQADYKL